MATKYVTETENQENVKSDDILMNVIRGINGGQTDKDQQEVSEATEEAKKKNDADNSNKKNNASAYPKSLFIRSVFTNRGLIKVTCEGGGSNEQLTVCG